MILGSNMASAAKTASASQIVLEAEIKGTCTGIGASVAQIVTEAQIVRGNVQ